ncbi:hypothetical protein CVT26_005788, partial [Gymnopilus dilepis]
RQYIPVAFGGHPLQAAPPFNTLTPPSHTQPPYLLPPPPPPPPPVAHQGLPAHSSGFLPYQAPTGRQMASSSSFARPTPEMTIPPGLFNPSVTTNQTSQQAMISLLKEQNQLIREQNQLTSRLVEIMDIRTSQIRDEVRDLRSFMNFQQQKDSRYPPRVVAEPLDLRKQQQRRYD